MFMTPTFVRMSRIILVAMLAPAVSLPLGAAAQSVPFETPTPRPATEVLPAELLRGPHFTVAPMVQNLGYMNAYTVNSDFGLFSANGDAMLRRLVREIAAIAALREIRGSEAFASALGQAALGSARGLKYVATEPVATLKAVPQGIFDVFSRTQESLSRDKTRYEDSSVKAALQVSANKRDYAAKLGVDVYSTNPVLQQELNSVAWAATGGQLTLSAASMAAGGPVAEGLSYLRNLDQARSIVAAQPPAALIKRNRAALAAMGADGQRAERFLAHREFSPRHQTLIVTALEQLNGVQGRANFLTVAETAASEEMALFYQRMAALLAGYHATIKPIARLEAFNRLIIAYSQDGTPVIIAPVDYAIWRESAAKAADAIAQRLHGLPPSKPLELWMTGVASPSFKTAAAARGIAVHEKIDATIPVPD
jgi:hypothetical protein